MEAVVVLWSSWIVGSHGCGRGRRREAYVKAKGDSAVDNDLLIVGPGVLGRLVARKWLQDDPGCRVHGRTMTTEHHDQLRREGIVPSLTTDKIPKLFPHVLFSAPPSPSTDYPGDLMAAASGWSGSGSFLFTSSTALYNCGDNQLFDEETPSVPLGTSSRTDTLIRAEAAIMDTGGCVLRLAGLYRLDRGPHVYWLRKGTVDSRPDHLVNLIHYEDAATLCVAILKKGFRRRVFLGSDNHPLTRREIMDLVGQKGEFRGIKFKGFTGTDGPVGKRADNSKTREELNWKPKFKSFAHFLDTCPPPFQ